MTEVTTGEGEAAETYYTVDIPDLALSTADEVVGYIYDEDTGTGETIAVVRFYVEEREQPTDYAGVNDVVTLQGLINATPHNNLASKQGGTTNQYYHLTSAEVGKVGKIKTSAAGIGIGDHALKDAIAGGGGVVSGNFAYGDNALEKLSTGSNNVAIGRSAGKIAGIEDNNTTAALSIFIGAQTKAKENGGQNEIVIGDQTTGAGSNTATLGNASITKTVLRGDVQIGTKITDSAGTGAATGITPAAGNNSTLLATTAYVKGEISGAAYTLPTASAGTLGGVKVGSGLTITDGVLAAAGSNVTIVDHVADLPEGVEGDFAVVLETTYETENYASITPVANPTHTATELITVALISTTSPNETWTLYITDDGTDAGLLPAEAGDIVAIVNSTNDCVYLNNSIEYDGLVGWSQILNGTGDISDSGGAALVRSVGHDLVNGDTVQISETSNYDGSYTVTVVDENTYTIGASFVTGETCETVVVRSLGATGFTALPVFTDCYLYITPAGASVDLSTLIYSPPNKKDLYAYDTAWNKITHSEHNNMLGRNAIGCHTAGAISMPVYTYSAAIISDAVNTHITNGAVEFTLPPVGNDRKYCFELWVKVTGADAVTFSAAVQWSGGTPHTFSSGTHYVEGIYNPIDAIWALKATAFAAPPT
jgi:hypothetical protein